MGRKKIYNDAYADPRPRAYSSNNDPEALSTDLTILQQIRQDEQTIIWGLDDALPMRILTAINESPITTLCLEKLEMFTRGSGFVDEGLMNMPINNDGLTLWELHCILAMYYVQLDAFSVNFKYNNGGKIIQAYDIPTESCRFIGKQETTEILGIKYNPYFGTKDYQIRFTQKYSLFDPKKVKDEASEQGNLYEGQIYFHGLKRTLYKHYPVPKYWTASKWIYSDAQNAEYNYNILANSFLQSALIKVIGDPNAMSRHPSSMKTITGTDGVQRKEPTKTNGQVFDEMMAANFSGVKKAGTVMAMWSLNKDSATDITAFPTTVNPDLISGALNNTIRMISGALQVPGILCNLPDSVSPLSGQDSLPHALDFMQANTDTKRTNLEKFYNTVLLPNFQDSTTSRVRIKRYTPTKLSIAIDKNIWDVMTVSEKRQYVKDKTEYNITVAEPTVTNPVQDKLGSPLVSDPPEQPNTQMALPFPNQTIQSDQSKPTVDEALKGLKVSELNRILSIAKKINSGSMTIDQAKMVLSGYGLNEDQINAFINPTIEQ